MSDYKFYGPFENDRGVIYKLNRGTDRFTIEFSKDELLEFGLKASSQIAKGRFHALHPDYEADI